MTTELWQNGEKPYFNSLTSHTKLFSVKSTHQFAGISEQQFNNQLPDGKMKASCSFSNNTAPVWYTDNLINKRPYCANCHLNSKKSDPLLLFFYIDFSSKPVKAAVRRAVGLLMKDSVCSDHLDICRCFEASHCLLRASVHSRRPPRATSWPQLSETRSHRTRRELFGREESGAPCKSMKTGGGICKRWVGLKREVCGPPRARQMMQLLEGKTTIAGEEWLLLMACMPLIKYWKMCVMLAMWSYNFNNVYQSLKEQRRLGLKIPT